MEQTTRKPRTEKVPGAYATVGAVRQHGGQLQVHRCTTCHAEVVWATSKRTGKPYLCNVRHGYRGGRYYIGADLHPRAEVCAASVETLRLYDERDQAINLCRRETVTRCRQLRAIGRTDDADVLLSAEVFDAAIEQIEETYRVRVAEVMAGVPA